MRVEVGSYTYNAGGRTVTLGLSLPVKAVFIFRSGDHPVFATDLMAGDTGYWSQNTAYFSGGITSIGTGQFSVGTSTSVNNSGSTHYYCAIMDDGQGDFDTFQYTGNATSPRNITGLLDGGTPVWAFVKPDAAAYAYIKHTSESGSNSWCLGTGTGEDTTHITTLGAGQITVESGFNSSSVQYDGFVFADFDGAIKASTYSGSEPTAPATQSVSISGTAFTPLFSFIFRGSSGYYGNQRFGTSGTTAWPVWNLGTSGDLIEAFNSGSFEVGSANTSGYSISKSGITYYYLVFADNPAAAEFDLSTTDTAAMGAALTDYAGAEFDIEMADTVRVVAQVVASDIFRMTADLSDFDSSDVADLVTETFYSDVETTDEFIRS